MATILFAAAPVVDDPSGGQDDAFGGLCEDIEVSVQPATYRQEQPAVSTPAG